MMKVYALFLLLFVYRCDSFSTSNPIGYHFSRKLSTLNVEKGERDHKITLDRQNFIKKAMISFSFVFFPRNTYALVEGNPVPASKKKTLSEEYRQGTAALGDEEANAPIPKEAYKKTPSGAIYADIRQGKGDDIVNEGSKVNIQWVLRRSNGYFVDSSEVNDSVPFIFTVGAKDQAIVGVDEGIRGMKAGGIRR